MKDNDINTIQFVLFKRRLTSEIRNYWYCKSSFEYSTRWWKDDDRYKECDSLTKWENDNCNPFNSIDISPKEYIELKDSVLYSIRCNTIINIVTAFETYLYYQSKHSIYLAPKIIEKSTFEIYAGELANSYTMKDQKEWLSELIVRKYIKNNSHREMIKKIDSLIKGGIYRSQEPLIERWCKKVLLRNALIHNSKLINEELIACWPDKYSNVGEKISLDDGDVIRTHSIAFELVKKMDIQFQRTVIKENDARLLARVSFLIDKNKSHQQIAVQVFHTLNYPITRDIVTSAIVYQEKSRAYIPDYNLLEDLIRNI